MNFDSTPTKQTHGLIQNGCCFKENTKSDGLLTHYKMRLGARKFTSQEGFVYVEKISPIMKKRLHEK
jgi:hypothetical protein